MPFLLGFLFLAAIYGLLFTVSRLEKKRKPQLKSQRVQAGFQPQTKPPHKRAVKAMKISSKRTGEQFYSAEVKASGHARKLKSALEELERRDQRLRELETDIWAQSLGTPSPKQNQDRKQSNQQPQDDWETSRQKVIKDDWQLPSQNSKTNDRILDGIQLKETQPQQKLEANQQRQIQDTKEQKIQQEIEADRQRLLQEKQEATRQIEADRLRLLREKDAAALKLEQDLEADRQRLRSAQQKSNVSDRATPKNVRPEPPKQSRQVTHKIKSKLEKLCGNDYRLAQRLVDGIRLDHPDRTEQWCWEKAIWDMERDRRY